MRKPSLRRSSSLEKIIKMTHRETPIGIVVLKKICACICPRLRFNRLLCYQSSVLILTYITYMTYHLTRKPISVVKNVLHQNCSELIPPSGVDPINDPTWCEWKPFENDKDANTLLGMLDSAFLVSYAIAMFVSGLIAERVNLRYFLSIGMLVSAIFCYLFGIAKTYNIHSMPYYIFVQAGAGIAQTTGWPGCVAVVGKWFGHTKQGLIFGIWNSHTSLGNILGTIMAAQFVETDWGLSFLYPALVMGICSFLVFLFLAPDPAQVGIVLESERSPQLSRSSSRKSLDESGASQVIGGDQIANHRPPRSSNTSDARHTQDIPEPTERSSLLGSSSDDEPPAVSMMTALAIPGVLEFSMSLFFAKLVSYTFLYWLPNYINNSTPYGAKASSDLSTLFDVGGIFGAIMAGALSDYTGCPGVTCAVFYVLCAPMLLAYQLFGNLSYGFNVLLLLINGLLVNAPYALITTAVAAQLGTHSSLAGNTKALATVTAIIDGTGSIGAAVGPLLAGVVSNGGHWSHVFYMLIVCDFAALFLLLRIVNSELRKVRHRRLLTAARAVRIE